MPLRINGFNLVHLDQILGPVIRANWLTNDCCVEDKEKMTNSEFMVKVFTAAKTGVLPRSMDFNSARYVFVPFPTDEENVLVLYTNRSGQSREVDRLWQKAYQLVQEYNQDHDLQLLTTKIMDWSTKQRTRGKRNRS